jgi:hypothetical protein
MCGKGKSQKKMCGKGNRDPLGYYDGINKTIVLSKTMILKMLNFLLEELYVW